MWRNRCDAKSELIENSSALASLHKQLNHRLPRGRVQYSLTTHPRTFRLYSHSSIHHESSCTLPLPIHSSSKINKTIRTKRCHFQTAFGNRFEFAWILTRKPWIWFRSIMSFHFLRSIRAYANLLIKIKISTAQQGSFLGHLAQKIYHVIVCRPQNAFNSKNVLTCQHYPQLLRISTHHTLNQPSQIGIPCSFGDKALPQ